MGCVPRRSFKSILEWCARGRGCDEVGETEAVDVMR
jgi:hypothetical protein